MPAVKQVPERPVSRGWILWLEQPVHTGTVSIEYGAIRCRHISQRMHTSGPEELKGFDAAAKCSSRQMPAIEPLLASFTDRTAFQVLGFRQNTPIGPVKHSSNLSDLILSRMHHEVSTTGRSQRIRIACLVIAANQEIQSALMAGPSSVHLLKNREYFLPIALRECPRSTRELVFEPYAPDSCAEADHAQVVEYQIMHKPDNET